MHDTPYPAEFWLAVEQFNQQDYYDCHDTLEALWIEAIAPDKTFYQGILQVAVALYHLSNQNWRGAVTLLGEGIHRLRPYQPEFASIDVEDFVQQSADLLSQLQQVGPEGVGSFSQDFFSPPATQAPAATPGRSLTLRRLPQP